MSNFAFRKMHEIFMKIDYEMGSKYIQISYKFFIKISYMYHTKFKRLGMEAEVFLRVFFNLIRSVKALKNLTRFWILINLKVPLYDFFLIHSNVQEIKFILAYMDDTMIPYAF